MDEEFDWFLKKFGAPTSRVEAPAATIERYSDKLPDRLLGYWQQYGFCGFHDGLFWLVDPEEYEPALDAWLDDTPIVEQDAFYVIGRSGFGALLLWGTKSGYRYEVDTARGWILEHDGNQADIGLGQADAALGRFFAIRKLAHFDFDDSDGHGLFDRAVEKLGPLAKDDVFAFEPSLMLGGTASLANIAKRNVHVHLSLLAQLGHREILDRQALTRKAFG